MNQELAFLQLSICSLFIDFIYVSHSKHIGIQRFSEFREKTVLGASTCSVSCINKRESHLQGEVLVCSGPLADTLKLFKAGFQPPPWQVLGYTKRTFQNAVAFDTEERKSGEN